VQSKNLDHSVNKEQQLRLKRSKGALAASLALIAWLSVGVHLQLVNPLAVSITTGWVFAISSIVFWLQKTGRNLRFKDPSFTEPLVLAATVCTLSNAIFLDPTSSGAVLLWLMLALVFSTFTSSPRSIMQIAYWMVIGLVTVAYIHHHLNKSRTFGVMLWHYSVILGALLSIATYGVWLNRSKAKNRRRQQLADITISSMADAVLNLDEYGEIVSANPAAERLFGVTRNTFRQLGLAETLKLVLLKSNDSQARWLLQHCGAKSGTARGRPYPMVAAANNRSLKVTFDINTLLEGYKTKRRIEVTLNQVLNKDSSNAGLLLVFKDITEQFNLMEQLNFDSTHDSMTGLLNRRGFEAKLDELEQIFQTHKLNTEFTIAILDLDNLKVVNDTCGHLAGDRLIESIGDALRSYSRPQDTVARYGGDEFAFIFSEASAIQAKDICERLVEQIKALGFQWEGKFFKTGASVGCLSVSKENFSRENCVSKADSALYLAKELGKGRIQFYDLKDSKITNKSQALDWASKINHAIENDSFQLYAQRVVSFDEQHADHFEVLLRLQDDDGKVIAPIHFLPAAERFNLMPSIDRWVLSHSLASVQQFHKKHRSYPKIAINLSAQSVMEVGFLDYVIEQVSTSEIPAHYISFELTETVAVGNFTGTRQFIEQVRLLGCEFQLDDVGAGFNSFSYLRELTFDAIKIDGHYVKDLPKKDVNRSIVQALANAASSINLQTIAEMIEDEATANTLLNMGIVQLQGYYFHRPEPMSAAFEACEPETKRLLMHRYRQALTDSA
jgi:diguanylate cyclase (GGDEF)-like protein